MIFLVNYLIAGQTTGAEIEFGNLDLSSYDVLVFGSNNAVYSEASIDAIESYIRGGGGAIFISDANFGSDWADASNSDQQFLDRFGLIVNQDRGTYSLQRSDGEFLIPDDPIFVGVDRIDGEGETPFQIGNLTVDFSDLSPFIAVLSSGQFQVEADVDGSGVVDFSDLSPFIAILSGV